MIFFCRPLCCCNLFCNRHRRFHGGFCWLQLLVSSSYISTWGLHHDAQRPAVCSVHSISKPPRRWDSSVCFCFAAACARATPRASEGLPASQQKAFAGYVHGGKAARVSRAVLQALAAQPGVACRSAQCSRATQSSTEHFAATAVPVLRSGADVAYITCKGNGLGDWIALPNSVTSR